MTVHIFTTWEIENTHKNKGPFFLLESVKVLSAKSKIIPGKM